MGQSRNNAEDEAAELKRLQTELIATLSQKVDVLTLQNKTGAADFFQLCTAQFELYDAKLDATDKPDERIALLNEQVKTAASALEAAEMRFITANGDNPNVLSAKALCLRIKVRLVRRARQAKG